jgi:hypothetical protein
MTAINALQKQGKKDIGGGSSPSRQVHNNLLKRNGIKYKSLFTQSDFHGFIKDDECISQADEGFVGFRTLN